MTGSSPAAMDEDVVSRKRRRNNESPNGPLTGQKRTVIACNECRKRKIKCSEERPCRRCKSNELVCVYAQNEVDAGGQRTSKEKIALLEHHVSLLQARVDQLSDGRQQIQEASQLLDRSPRIAQNLPQSRTRTDPVRRSATPTQPQFVGPTSSAYNFKIANHTLQMMGILNDLNITLDGESVGLNHHPSLELPGQNDLPTSEPLLLIGMSETYRALEIYKEELRPIYPFIPLDEIHDLVPSIYEHLHRGHRSISFENDGNHCYQIDKQDVNILKMIVASSLVLEGRGRSSLGQRLVDSVDTELSASLRQSIYYFHCDEPVLAWRTIGYAARIALEMGLHRRESLEKSYQDLERRGQAVRLFWCIYILDRRWSFETGMPFVLQDSDIDPDLPPVHDSEPYLKCLVAYGRICSRVWNTVASFGKKAIDKDTIGYLDFQIQRWLLSIPNDLQLLHPRLGDAASNQPCGLQRLRVLLYIRGNHMRSFLHRHNILSVSSVTKNLTGARLVTDIAKDTIRVLVHLRETSTIYDTQQSAFNYFLVSALSAIFLAVCHAPREFAQSCRNEFYSALGLLNDLSIHSYISHRLWKSVRGLQQIAPRLGLTLNRPLSQKQNTNASDNAHQSHPVEGLPASSENGAIAEVSPASQVLHPENPSHVALSTSFKSPGATMMSMSNMSPSSIPKKFEPYNNLTNMFEALGHDINGQEALNSTPSWMAEEINLLQNGDEVTRLFESLL